MGFAGSTALLFEDAHPVQPVILQASRYQGIRVNAGGCRNGIPTRASMFETSANKKAYGFRAEPNLMLLRILMSFTNCEAQDLNHVTVFRMRGSEISTHHMLCHLACPISKRTLPLNKFLPAP
jgi:hypothetical protein